MKSLVKTFSRVSAFLDEFYFGTREEMFVIPSSVIFSVSVHVYPACRPCDICAHILGRVNCNIFSCKRITQLSHDVVCSTCDMHVQWVKHISSRLLMSCSGGITLKYGNT
jgi:hypothetical protein